MKNELLSFYKNMYFNRIQHIKIKKINLKKQASVFFSIFYKKGLHAIKIYPIFALAKQKRYHSSVGRAKD